MATFIVVWFIFLCFVLAVCGVESTHQIYRNLQSRNTNSSNQPYRTGYHFQPSKNWINDPNGPMIYKGIYHLFYQYNPLGPLWGNIVWAHATSTDLVNWIHHDNSIYPTIQSDINGCWSGSTTILPGEKPVILYTGIDSSNKQVQNLAIPKNISDPFLREWIKSPQNPIIVPPSGINGNSFRDPTTAWKGPDGRWRVIIGSKRGTRGMAILYRSKDFVHWIKSQHPLYSVNASGMWECPDFFPVSINSTNGVDTSTINPSIKHVLKVSLGDTGMLDIYTIGNYVHDKDEYIPNLGSTNNGSGLRFDYGKFYASKTFFDGVKNRRILWGWISESDTSSDAAVKGWSGIQSIPRNVWLDKTGQQLVQWPVEEIKKLRSNVILLQNKELNGGSILNVSGVTASQADVEISFELSELEKAEIMDPTWVNPQLLCSQKGASVKGSIGPFGLLVFASKNLEEYTAIFFRVFKGPNKYVVLMCSDQNRSSLREDLDKTSYGAFLNVDPLHEKLSLRSLIDHSVVESFGGEGKVCITARVYPKLAIDDGAHLYTFNDGSLSVTISTLSAWSMKRAQIK